MLAHSAIFLSAWQMEKETKTEKNKSEETFFRFVCLQDQLAILKIDKCVLTSPSWLPWRKNLIHPLILGSLNTLQSFFSFFLFFSIVYYYYYFYFFNKWRLINIEVTFWRPFFVNDLFNDELRNLNRKFSLNFERKEYVFILFYMNKSFANLCGICYNLKCVFYSRCIFGTLFPGSFVSCSIISS